MIVATAPPTMKGRRFPNRERHLSDLIPTYGCTSVPESGPAIQTSASRDLLTPRPSKNGEPLDNSTDQVICRLKRNFQLSPPDGRVIMSNSPSYGHSKQYKIPHALRLF
jgi:hypothetical protein